MARRNRDDDDDDDDTPDVPRTPKPRADAYVGMLGVTFLALAGAATFLYLDYESLNAQQLQAPTVNIPGLGNATPAGN